MGLFDAIKHAIFDHSTAATSTPSQAVPPAAAVNPTAALSVTPAQSATQPTPSPQPPAVDVEAILAGLAAKNPQKLNWQSSIVDLMKLLGLDSSFQNRMQLAKELGYTGNPADSATMNIWLQKQVMKKLAESGGKVPPSLRE